MQVVQRALEVLTEIGRYGSSGISLQELADTTELAPSTVHRHITTLVESGYVTRDPRTKVIRLGPRAAAFGSMWLAPGTFHHRLHSSLSALRERLGETAFASQLSGDEVICVALERSTRPLHLSVRLGQSLPAAKAASARAILAFEAPSRALEVALGSKSTASREAHALLEQFEVIRDRGYDVCESELDADVFAVAAPVFGANRGQVVASVAVAGPILRLTGDDSRQEAIDAVLEAAAVVSVNAMPVGSRPDGSHNRRAEPVRSPGR